MRRGRQGSRRLERVGNVRGVLERSYPLDVILLESMSMAWALIFASSFVRGSVGLGCQGPRFRLVIRGPLLPIPYAGMDTCGSALSLGYPWPWLILGPDKSPPIEGAFINSV